MYICIKRARFQGKQNKKEIFKAENNVMTVVNYVIALSFLLFFFFPVGVGFLMCAQIQICVEGRKEQKREKQALKGGAN